MSNVKVVEPNYFVVRFYFYYSYCTLIISWILAPILFYIILTQSKKLGNFKWFILNHSFWCLIHSTFCSLIKPVLLTPAAAGYQIGIFHNNYLWGYQSSTIFSAINRGLSCNCVVGVSATVGSRYMLIFPNGKWFNLKIAFIFAIFIHSLCYSLIGYVFYPLIYLDQSLIHQWARDYDNNGLQKYFKEPTFFMIPHSYHDFADILTMIFFIVTHICGGTVFLLFVYHIFTRKSKILTTKLQRSLIISSMLQMGLTSAFLFSPFMFFFFVIRFDIPNSSTLMTLLLCIASTHCLIKFFVTLFFISPYRNFISQYLRDSRVSSSNNVSLITSSF